MWRLAARAAVSAPRIRCIPPVPQLRLLHTTRINLSNAAPPGAPSGTAKPAGDTQKIIRTLLHYVWPAGEPGLRARVVVAMLLLVGAKVLNIQVPFLFKEAADQLGAAAGSDGEKRKRDGTEEGGSKQVGQVNLATAVPLSLLLGYGIARSTSAGFAELRNTIFASVAQRAIRLVSRDVFRHLLQLDLRFHLDRQTGALTRVIDRGSRSINFVLTSLVFNVVPTALEIALVCGIFATQCGIEYAVTTLSTLVAYVAYTVKVTTWRTGIRKELNKLENEASSKAVDSLLNYESVSYFNNTEHQVQKYDATLAGLDKASLTTQSSLSMLNFGQNAIFSVGLTAAMVMASRDILAGNMTVGDLILVNGLLFQLSIPLNFVGMVYREVRQGLVDMDAMFKLLETKSTVREPKDAVPLVIPPRLPAAVAAAAAGLSATAATVATSQHAAAKVIQPGAPVSSTGQTAPVAPTPLWYAVSPALRFHDLRFAYHADRTVLNGVSFEVPTGSTVAVVGSSGCGKSTLIRLLYRFFDVEGSDAVVSGGVAEAAASPDSTKRPGIYLHGQDIRLVKLYSLRAALGVVPQDTTLFNDTVHNNIAFGAPGAVASREDVMRAAKAAHIHNTIMTFPQGYEARVGERGLKLSGGEKQRVAIARAILKDAPVLLWDEATSQLDSGTEAAIMSALKELSADRTALLIAHRLATVRDADAIVVMDKGRVVETGKHTELLARGGMYAQMWDTQQRSEAKTHKTHATH